MPVYTLLADLPLSLLVKILIYLIMKTKKKIWICALLLCVTLFISVKSYSTEAKKLPSDPLELLILTKGDMLK